MLLRKKGYNQVTTKLQHDPKLKRRIFLGLTNFLKRFISDYSTKTYHLRQLIKENAKFEWNADCEQSLKKRTDNKTCVSYSHNNRETILYTHVSPYGLAAPPFCGEHHQVTKSFYIFIVLTWH